MNVENLPVMILAAMVIFLLMIFGCILGLVLCIEAIIEAIIEEIRIVVYGD